MAKKKASEVKGEPEEFVYLGERVFGYNRRISQVFKNAKGKEILFSGIRGIMPGQVFWITDGTIKTRPEPIEEPSIEMSEKDWIEYEAQKAIVKIERLRRKKAMNLKAPHPDIKRAIDLLRPFAANLSSIDLRRFAEYIQNEISVKKRK